MACKPINHFFLLLIINVIYVEVSSKCHHVPTVIPPFNEMEGKWYPIQTGDPLELSRNCVTYNFTYSKTKEGEVIRAYRLSDTGKQEKFKAVLLNGRVTVQRKGNKDDHVMNLLVPSVDPNKYYVSYICDPKSNDLGFVYVSVRHRYLENYYRKFVETFWTKFGFNKKEMFGISQQGCPNVEG
ncbi:uncharacterized protein [Onthophagus taurus]|uniref:uncharacterized protein n=1 Tax=Onthophagus taurus TaxID=166361 RepID=UPI000C20A6B7|nr:uncharacterized protein LOC111418482 [Onthophagus taurus]